MSTINIARKALQCKEGIGNVLKSRDDKDLVVFDKDLNLMEGCDCSWAESLETGGDDEHGDEFMKRRISVFRERIEPWLTSLFQSEHLNLLCGSGLTNAISMKAVGNGGANMNGVTFSVFDKKIKEWATIKAQKAGRKDGNIEDQIRTATELIRGLEILGRNKANELQDSLNEVLKTFAESILMGEYNIATADATKRKEAFDILVNFILSFSSRTGSRERLNIFTTNYDRLIELGADLAGIHVMDRFVGTMMPIFRSSRLNLDIHYNPPGIRGEPRYLEGVVRMTKLHGSIDWIKNSDDICRIGLPFGAKSVMPYIQAPGLVDSSYLNLMIYPNPDKDKETAEYPYVELFRDFAAAICRPNSTLVTYGYGFGDDHINRVIKDMLTIPSTHLVIISYNDPIGRILKFYEDVARNAQMTIMIGPHFGDITTLTDNYLPKSAIDRTTFKLSELLQRRMGASQQPAKKVNEAEKNEE